MIEKLAKVLDKTDGMAKVLDNLKERFDTFGRDHRAYMTRAEQSHRHLDAKTDALEERVEAIEADIYEEEEEEVSAASLSSD